MDEAAREKAGAAPLRAELDKVAALKSLNDLATFLRRPISPAAGSQFLFGFSSGQDFADSTRIIAFLGAGGLGLPDRDYYTKTDPKSVEIREHYLAARPENARAVRRARHASKDRRPNRHEHRNRASQSLADARRAARSAQALPPLHASEIAALTPSFPWKSYFATFDLARVPPLNVTEPAFYTEVYKRSSNPALSTIGKPTCAGTSRTPKPRYSPPPSSPRTSISTTTTCAASKPCSPCGSAASSASTTTLAKP